GSPIPHPQHLFDRFGLAMGTVDADPLAWVLSRNLHRRHLSESQRAMVAAKLATMTRGRPGENEQICRISSERAGELLNVSRRSIGAARAVRAEGVPELSAAVEAGDVSVSAAAALASLPLSEQAVIVARGKAEIIAAAKRYRDENTARKKALRAEKEARLGAKQRALPDRRYGVIYADPEWRFENWNNDTGNDRGPENHYPTSDLETICRRDVASIAADDSVLFLWVPMSMLPDGLTVMARWGFTYKTGWIWVKDKAGLGRWVRSLHEVLLLGTRGAPPCPAPGTQWQSVITAPLGRHSEKPENFHRLIEDYFPTLPKIELNARKARPGWDAWGFEAEGEG
ncbi:MAG: MT-A70 family protein, partial [Xanthobacteraceae bacterium]